MDYTDDIMYTIPQKHADLNFSTHDDMPYYKKQTTKSKRRKHNKRLDRAEDAIDKKVENSLNKNIKKTTFSSPTAEEFFEESHQMSEEVLSQIKHFKATRKILVSCNASNIVQGCDYPAHPCTDIKLYQPDLFTDTIHKKNLNANNYQQPKHVIASNAGHIHCECHVQTHGELIDQQLAIGSPALQIHSLESKADKVNYLKVKPTITEISDNSSCNSSKEASLQSNYFLPVQIRPKKNPNLVSTCTTKEIHHPEIYSRYIGTQEDHTVTDKQHKSRKRKKNKSIGNLRVAIIDKTYSDRRISKIQADLLIQQLRKALDTVLFHERKTSTPPTFHNIEYSDHVLKIVCENQESLKWLDDTVNSLPQLWANSDIALVEVSQLPNAVILGMLFIPGEPEDENIILHRLNMQNLWANIKEWRLVNFVVKDKPIGVTLTFGINPEYHTRITSRKNMLFYGFTSLYLTINEPRQGLERGSYF